MNDIDAAYERADRLADVGRYTEAETIVRAALGQAPDNADLLTMLGYLLRRQQRYLDALAACEAAVAVAPESGAAHEQRAWTLISIYRLADAITAATEAVRLDPHLPDRYIVLAEALAQDNQVDDARGAARQALRLRPRSVPALLTLAAIERDAGNLQAAGEVTRQALAIDPASTRGRRMLALLDADRGLVRRSIRMLAEIARDKPADPDLMSLVWPIRRVVVAPRRWLPGAAAGIAAAGLAAAALDHRAAASAVRIAAALTGAVTVGFGLRTLIPAGRLPWAALRRSPPLVRRSLGTGLAVITVAVGLLGGYAAGGPVALPLLAVAAAPALSACMLGERLGHNLNDAGGRQFLQDWRLEFRDVMHNLRAWPGETRRDLRASRQQAAAEDRERKRRQAAMRQPLAVYRSQLRNNIRCAQFGLLTLLATYAAAASRASTAQTIGFSLLALLMLRASVRVPRMKAVAAPAGLILHGSLLTWIVPWERVAHVVADDAATITGLIPLRAPTLLLTNGRRLKIKHAAFYNLSAHHHPPTPVNDIAAELETLRHTYSPRPETTTSR